MDGPAVLIIHLQESGSLLDRVLRFWYPGTQPDIANLSQLREVLQILIFKYDIEFVAYSGKKHLREYIPTDAVAVFAIAGHHQWRDVAIAAAKETLALPLGKFDDDPSLELLHITATMYHGYHSQCGKTAREQTLKSRWEKRGEWVWFSCRTCASHSEAIGASIGPFHGQTPRVTVWFMTLMEELAQKLATTPGMDVRNDRIMAAAFEKVAACGYCRKSAFEQLPLFLTTILRPKIGQAMENVCRGNCVVHDL
jgi:hypothetical protein